VLTIRPSPIYLDYNATVDPRVAEAALPYLTHHFGNPSSGHRRSRAAEVANLIGAEPDRIVFTGSGSEADALAIQGGVLAADGKYVISQVTEHPAVLGACQTLRRRHASRRPISLSMHLAESLRPICGPALTQPTSLVSIMYANNETGVVQPIAGVTA
jgi:cysteine desulfurase